MLTPENLKNYLHRDLKKTDKVLLILGAIEGAALIGQIREVGRSAGLREIDKWNVSEMLSRAKGLAINTPAGWELIDEGKRYLASLGFTPVSQPTRQQILKAVDAIAKWGHSTFDRMLLEFGIEDVGAGREVGSLTARGNALAKYVLANPTILTPEGIPLSAAIIDYALGSSKSDQTGSLEAPVLDDSESGRPEVPEAIGGIDNDAVFAMPKSVVPNLKSNKVFLVHGRTSGAKHEVARYLERLGVDVTILHERPNKGRTLISKFQEEAADISYAVVLMTPDDHGGLAQEQTSPRARQNVVFELGFFIGRLGASNVCALVVPGIEKPSDFESVVYVEFSEGKPWQIELARELRAAGVPFDHSKVF